MNPIDTLSVHSRYDIGRQIQHLIQDNVWSLLTFIGGLFLLYLVRSFADQLVHGMVWRRGRRYNENDVVLVDDEYARIVRIGWFFTEFYIYKLNDVQEPITGWSLMVANDKLRDMKIKKPLSRHESFAKLESIIR